MKNFFLYNGDLIEGTTIPIDIFGSFYEYGVGVVETISVYQEGSNVRFFFLQQHWDRAIASCRELGFCEKVDFKSDSLEKKLQHLIFCIWGVVGNRWIRVKVRFYEEKKCTSFVATVSEVPHPGGGIEIGENDLVQDDSLRRYKTGFYMHEYVHKQLGVAMDEFVIDKQGNILEARRGNILAVREKTLYVVDPQKNYLCGILQKKIMTQYRRWFSDIKFLKGMSREFLQTSQVLYTNSIRWVMSVKNIGIQKDLPKKILDDLLKDFKM